MSRRNQPVKSFKRRTKQSKRVEPKMEGSRDDSIIQKTPDTWGKATCSILDNGFG